ncbi:MAG: T9SS type A sorting domain-containing protein, partial [Chitinophagales bacterium]
TPTANGSYAVIVTQNTCTDTSACQIVSTVGIAENDFGKHLSVFPNPTSGQLTINLGAVHNEVTAIIRNLIGQETFRKNFESVDKLILNLQVEPGVYIIEILADDKKALIKAIRE